LGLAVEGDNAGFVENDAFTFGVNQGVCGTKIDSKVAGQGGLPLLSAAVVTAGSGILLTVLIIATGC
jgi:hypothetical protein